MSPIFPIDATAIQDRLDSIDPVRYARTRNYLSGGVTLLSPYISRGYLSLPEVLRSVRDRGYDLREIEPFIQQLAWREFFQRTWQWLEDGIFDDIRRRHTGVRHRQLPVALPAASTGIDAVDQAIRELMETGYMHNHLRLYTASIACNVGKAWWPAPSQWMYYHLLDGDLASNACSWQWVAGQYSTRQYYCNQENVNRYTGSRQTGTFLDTSYEALPFLEVPGALQETAGITLQTILPKKKMPALDPEKPLLLYTSYQIDPNWRSEEAANRVLVLEPSHFNRFPVSDKVLSFIVGLAANIPGMQVFTGEVGELLQEHRFPVIRSKEHPISAHFPGLKDEREWLFPECKGLFPSFSSYWKKAVRSFELRTKRKQELQEA